MSIVYYRSLCFLFVSSITHFTHISLQYYPLLCNYSILIFMRKIKLDRDCMLVGTVVTLVT